MQLSRIMFHKSFHSLLFPFLHQGIPYFYKKLLNPTINSDVKAKVREHTESKSDKHKGYFQKHCIIRHKDHLLKE